MLQMCEITLWNFIAPYSRLNCVVLTIQDPLCFQTISQEQRSCDTTENMSNNLGDLK